MALLCVSVFTDTLYMLCNDSAFEQQAPDQTAIATLEIPWDVCFVIFTSKHIWHVLTQAIPVSTYKVCLAAKKKKINK